MLQFDAVIKRFQKQGEKTGWTYIDVPSALSEKLMPGTRKGFRVKGKIDNYSFSLLALIPMGNGDFILTLNASSRKGIGKPVGATVRVRMEVDTNEILPPPELMECLEDEPEALAYFKSIPKGHQNYFSNWIRSAKTEPTKARRIAAAINALTHRWDFGQMIRDMRKNKIS